MIKDKNSNISAEVTVIQNGLDGYTFGDTEGIADDVQLEVVKGKHLRHMVVKGLKNLLIVI